MIITMILIVSASEILGCNTLINKDVSRPFTLNKEYRGRKNAVKMMIVSRNLLFFK